MDTIVFVSVIRRTYEVNLKTKYIIIICIRLQMLALHMFLQRVSIACYAKRSISDRKSVRLTV